MNQKVCDVCGDPLDKHHTRATYTIKRKVFLPILHFLSGEKVEKLEVCNYCMNKIVFEILNKKSKRVKNDRV